SAAAADNPNQAVIDQAEAAKAVAEAQTAAANAQKAQYEAQAAALKAKFGDIPDSGYGGTATAAAGAGNAEASLLGAKALQAIAARIAAEVCLAVSAQAGACSAPTSGAGSSTAGAPAAAPVIDAQPIVAAAAAASAPSILVFGATTVPDFQALTAFKAQYAFLEGVFNRATTAAPPGDVSARVTTFLAPVAAIGLGLDAINKLLAFAKTDYTFAALEVTGTDAMLLTAVAHELPSRVATVQFPAVYSADIVNSVNLVFDQITKVYDLGVQARQNQRAYEAAQVQAEKELAADPNNPKKKEQVAKCKEG